MIVVGWLGGGVFAQSSYRVIEVMDGGTIRGIVTLDGTSPTVAQLPITKDNKSCGKKKQSPRLVIGKNKTVKNAIISIEGITQGKDFSHSNHFVLEQERCEYEPHILILPLGSNLEILNDDPILHNVHAYSDQTSSRSIFNIAQPIKGQRTTVKQNQLNTPGLIEATCDAGHPWMSGYIVVAEHPYLTLTDEAGRFELTNIPPGTYTLKMWHEGVAITNTQTENGKVKKYFYEAPYEESKEITVLPKETHTVDFEFSLR